MCSGKEVEKQTKNFFNSVGSTVENVTKTIVSADPVVQAVQSEVAKRTKQPDVSKLAEAADQPGITTTDDDEIDNPAPDAPEPTSQLGRLLALRRQLGSGRGIRLNMLTGGLGVRGSAPTRKRNLLGA